MSCGQVKNSLTIYFSLTRTSYLVTGQVKILMYLPGGQVKILDFFTPALKKKTGIFFSLENLHAASVLHGELESLNQQMIALKNPEIFKIDRLCIVLKV